MSLRAYNVPKEETEQAIRFVEGLDIRTISEQVMQALFRALAMRFEFSLAGITLPAQKIEANMYCKGVLPCIGIPISRMQYPQSPLAPKTRFPRGRDDAREESEE